ncbi:DUF885 family protein [Pontibacter sp. G13]|uniref:DUF885 family protein n=1 Tax=Pontibacter sp. G13 TaxID=3074898 RepID=UPI0028899BD3|nr:DUF885 family protein [Pontibacter sp. G13]WNJ20907.1 DUF885 family protein [Pontibacter sp. G13]
MSNSGNAPRMRNGILVGIALLVISGLGFAGWRWYEERKSDLGVVSEELIELHGRAQSDWLSHLLPVERNSLTLYNNRFSQTGPQGLTALGNWADFLLETLPEGDASEDVQFVRDRAQTLKQLSSQSCMVFPTNPVSGVPFSQLNTLVFDHHIERKDDAEAYIQRIKTLPNLIRESQAQSLKFDQDGQGMGKWQWNEVLNLLSYWQVDSAMHHPIYRAMAIKLRSVNPIEMNEYDQGDYLERLAEVLEQRLKPALTNHYAFAKRMKEEASDSLIHDFSAACASSWIAWEWGATPELDSLANEIDQWLEAHPYIEFSESVLSDSADKMEIIIGTLQESRSLFGGIYSEIPWQRIRQRNETHPVFPAIYMNPVSLDGARPATLHIRPDALPDREAELDMLTYEWLLPGKKFWSEQHRKVNPQSSVVELMAIPALEEGWGLYALHVLESSLQLFPEGSDLRAAYVKRMRLAAAITRAEIGWVHQNWSPAKTSEYLTSTLGCSESEAHSWLVKLESVPGRMSAGWYGYQRLLRMERFAKKHLGDKFYIREYHDFLLSLGHSSWEGLENQISD